MGDHWLHVGVAKVGGTQCDRLQKYLDEKFRKSIGNLWKLQTIHSIAHSTSSL